MSYVDDSVVALGGFEGRVHWMYLDTVGKVTCAVGKMLQDALSACRLPWRNPQSGDLASASAVQLCFVRVSKMELGHLPGYYQEYESLVLNDADIDQLLRDEVAEVEAELRKMFLAYDSFPDPAKLGLIDMGYNLGAEKLHREYPMFCGEVLRKSWKFASEQCHRVGPDEARNDWTKQQFEMAA